MWLEADNIKCKHGFSTRHGGVSPSPFKSLNLGGSQDDPLNISRNRQIALDALGLQLKDLCYLKQVHGVTVCNAQPGIQEGDALVTDKKGLVLAVSIADCYPILFYDEVNSVIGAAHAGWRGTLAGVAANTILAMKKLGADPGLIKVAIGQGISQGKFEVGNEVIQQFREKSFPESCWKGRNLDLVKCNLHVLVQNNILDKNISTIGRYTFEDDFFSYRRDNGITGRMWGLITLQ